MEKLDVAVLGGGISGLTMGVLLKRKGFSVGVFEATGRPGGCITSWRKDGFLFELGPNTVLNNALEIDYLCEIVGLLESRIKARPASKKRYIVRNGRLVPLPGGPISFLATKAFSWGAKLRLLKEPFVSRAPEDREETIAEFTRRRLGPEFLDYAVGPFVSGVYAGDPGRLSVRHATRKIYALEEKYGGLIKGALAKRKGPAPGGGLFTFPRGMETLPKVIAGHLGNAWHPQRKVESVERGGHGYLLTLAKHDVAEEYSAKAVVSAIPAESISNVFHTFDGSFPTEVSSLPYADVAVVSLGFRRSQVEHPLNGFGFLVPEVEDRYVLGCLFPSSLFPDRAPADHVALTAFLGGALHPERASDDTDRLLSKVLKDIGPLLGISGEPILCRVERWRPAIPQYHVGHGKLKESAEDFEEKNPGVFISGNVLHGVSVGDCIKNASELMPRVQKYLRS
jgi:oxygen-dependent protoporphyrinogen oxidase